MTEWGEVSVHRRGRYYYAVKTINGLKRQVYLGKTVPGQGRFEEVGAEIYQKADNWVRTRRKHRVVDTSDDVSVAVEQLAKIEELAKARGESAIAKQIREVVRVLSGTG